VSVTKMVNNDCWMCVHKRDVPGNAHIGCANPDPHMTGDPHGVRNGWFMYPAVDIRAAAAPRSDQLNYEDLIDGPRTIRVTEVKAGTKEQPIEVHYANGEGRPFKPCKSMLRVLIASWGDKGTDWVGRSMTLYGDPEVRFGGVAIGGIRISHVSHIEQPLSVLLSTSRGKRKPYVVKPLKAQVAPIRDDRPPLDLSPPTEADAAFSGLLRDMRAAADTERLAEIVTDFDMDSLSESQKEAARDLYRELKANLEQ